MLRYIIGGVALGAIGYGLKAYINKHGLFEKKSYEHESKAVLKKDHKDKEIEYFTEYEEKKCQSGFCNS